MELMDKAMGEILRRLPIIILEDSTLHPDFALLVWAMVAESKVCPFGIFAAFKLVSFYLFDLLTMILAGLCSSTSTYYQGIMYRL